MYLPQLKYPSKKPLYQSCIVKLVADESSSMFKGLMDCMREEMVSTFQSFRTVIQEAILRMPSCMVKTCKFSWKTRRKETVLHSFPRARDRIKHWLQLLRYEEECIDSLADKISQAGKGIYRVCSHHFDAQDYEIRGSHKYLKSDAFPKLNLFKQCDTTHTRKHKLKGTNDDHLYTKRTCYETSTTRQESLHFSEISDGTYSTPSDIALENIANSCSTCSKTSLVQEMPFIDCVLDGNDDNTNWNLETINFLQGSKTKIKRKCRFPEDHILKYEKEKGIKKINKYTQFNKRHGMMDKKIQIGIPKKMRSVSVQCNLANLPPISLLQKNKNVQEINLEVFNDDTFNCLFDEVDSSNTPMEARSTPAKASTNSALPGIKVIGLSPVSKIENHPNKSITVLSDLYTITTHQNCSKDDSYLSGLEEEQQFVNTQLENNLFYIDPEDRDQSFIDISSILKNKNVANDRKFLVFESCLNDLLFSARCKFDSHCCGTIASLKKHVVGSALVIHAMCTQKHLFKLWSSQPFIGHIPSGDLAISASILCSGGRFLKISNFLSLLQTPSISVTTYYRHQKNVLFPTIEHHWLSERKKVIESFGHKAVALLGDGQCDAKYCIYTFMDAESRQIVDFQIEQLQPGRTSVSLEKAFKTCLDRLLNDNVKVKVIATDRHTSIRKIMKEQYCNIKHEFDVWHMAKSIGAKLQALSKQSNAKELSGWVNLTKNHLLWASRSCQHNKIILKEKWLSIAYHASNVHEWQDCTLYQCCDHPPIPSEEERDYEWLKSSSAAHHKLVSVVQDPCLLKDLEHLSGFYHTGELEVYHSMALKYRPKRNNFLLDGMIARTQLAALYYNLNIDRLQAVVQNPRLYSEPQGTHFWYGSSKAKKDLRVAKMYDPKDQTVMLNIISAALDYAAREKDFNWYL